MSALRALIERVSSALTGRRAKKALERRCIEIAGRSGILRANRADRIVGIGGSVR